MGIWSVWSFSLLALLLLHLSQPKFMAQAEISSPGTNGRLHRLEVTPPEARVTKRSKVTRKVAERAKVLRAFETETAGDLKANNGKQVGNETLSGLGNEPPIGVKTAPNYQVRLNIPGEKYDNDYEDNQRRRAANVLLENKFPNTRKRAKRDVGTAYAENVDMSKKGEAQSRDRFVETVQAASSSSRAEYRRTGEEARGSNPRQNEPHLDTSTFALSGDSAHNQAMVHWSGHNSSVSLSFTKKTLHYKDF